MAVIAYIILPFVVSKRGGKLVPGTPQRAKDQAKAVLAAESIAGQYAGVVVLEEQSDPEQDIFAALGSKRIKLVLNGGDHAFAHLA